MMGLTQHSFNNGLNTIVPSTGGSTKAIFSRMATGPALQTDKGEGEKTYM